MNLIKKYKKYKKELEIITDPNKKLCPYPNCDSYLELKDIKQQYISCENRHEYCFVCLKKPHGNLPCNVNLDKSIIEYASNNFVKKCPNCSIITEKNDGCNHITCSKCRYQWCWLCNEKFDEEHFYKGKCRGFQFYQPKNEYEIKLMMEGKINSDELSQSQRQNIDFLDDIVNPLENNNINSISTLKKIFYVITFLLLGCPRYIFKKYNYYWICIFILLTIASFFPLFICNLISFLTFIIRAKFNVLIRLIDNSEGMYSRTGGLLMSNLFLGIFCHCYLKIKESIRGAYKLKEILRMIAFFPCLFILFFVFFPNILLYNIIYMIILLIRKGSWDNFLDRLDLNFQLVFGFSILDLDL